MVELSWSKDGGFDLLEMPTSDELKMLEAEEAQGDLTEKGKRRLSELRQLVRE